MEICQQSEKTTNNQCLPVKKHKRKYRCSRHLSKRRLCREMRKKLALILHNKNNEANLQINQSKCNAIKADTPTVVSCQRLPTKPDVSKFRMCKIYEEYEGKLEELKLIEGSIEIIDLNEEEQHKLSNMNGTIQIYAIMPGENEEDMFDEMQKTSNLTNQYDLLSQDTVFSSQETMFLSQDTIPLSQETISNDTEFECSWVVEKAKPEAPEQPVSEGIDFVDFKYVFDQILKLDEHSNIGCGIRNFKIIGYQKCGLIKTYNVQCQMCNRKMSIPCIEENDDVMDINHSAVSATMLTGGAYSQLEQIMSSINVSCMSRHTYEKCQEKIINAFELAALQEMKAAGKQERDLAIERGDICPGSDIPWIPVVSDGSWMKRSYKGGYYNSLSGVGAIVGYYTRKVLYISVKNKYCCICQHAAKKKEQPRKHRCFKNWDRNQSSAGMESAAILEGFKCSLDMHGLVYRILIADGDSNTYKKILDCDPYKQYSVTVQKIECSNHMLRNFGRKMNEIVARGGCKELRAIVKRNILRLRIGIRKAAAYRCKEDLPWVERIENLKLDLINVPSHVFGEHKDCEKLAYFCKQYTDPNIINYVPQLKEAGIYKRIEEAMQPLFNKIESVLYGSNNNSVECFNSIISKFIGGKRVNYACRGSYQGRVSAAVIQYNTKEVLSRLSRAMNKEPTVILKNMENRRKNALKKAVQCRERVKASSTRKEKQTCDKDYGPCAEQQELKEIAYMPQNES